MSSLIDEVQGLIDEVSRLYDNELYDEAAVTVGVLDAKVREYAESAEVDRVRLSEVSSSLVELINEGKRAKDEVSSSISSLNRGAAAVRAYKKV